MTDAPLNFADRPRIYDTGGGDALPPRLAPEPEPQPSPARPAGFDGLPMPKRLTAILAVSFGSALVVIDGAIPTVALPTIARDLHVGESAVVSIVTTYQLILVMALLPFSGLGSRIGLRRMYQIGQLIFTVATLLCFFAHSLAFLIIVRIAQAFGAAAALGVSSALVRSIYPARQLGRGLALNSLVVSSGAAIAPTLGGFVLGVAPWPWVFASAVPFALLSLLFGRALPDPKVHNEPFDLLGAIMVASMFGLVIGGAESAVHGNSPVVSAAIVGAGLFVGVLIYRNQKDDPAPILPIDLLRQPVIGLSVLGGFCAFIASMSLILSMSFRLQHAFGFSPSGAGAVIALWPLTMMVVAPLAGSLSDRVPAGLLGGVGMAVGVGGLLLVAYMPPHPSAWDAMWRMAVCGAGFGFFFSPNARLIIGEAPRHRIAPAGGLVSTTRLIGQTTGATTVAALLALGLGTGRTPPLVAACLAAIAGICSVARLRPSIRGNQAHSLR